MPRIQDIFFMGTLHGVVRPSVWNLAYPGKNWTMNNQGGKTEVLSGWKAHQSRPIRRPPGAPSLVGHKGQSRWQTLWRREARDPCESEVAGDVGGAALGQRGVWKRRAVLWFPLSLSPPLSPSGGPRASPAHTPTNAPFHPSRTPS